LSGILRRLARILDWLPVILHGLSGVLHGLPRIRDRLSRGANHTWVLRIGRCLSRNDWYTLRRDVPRRKRARWIPVRIRRPRLAHYTGIWLPDLPRHPRYARDRLILIVDII